MKFSTFNFPCLAGRQEFSKLFGIVFLIFLVFSLIPTQATQAAGLVPCGGTGQPACGFCDIFKLGKNIVDFFAKILVPSVAVLMFVIAGFFFLTSGGNPQKAEQAKAVLTATVVGLIIIFGAYVLLNAFLSLVGVQEWTGLKHLWQIRGCGGTI